MTYKMRQNMSIYIIGKQTNEWIVGDRYDCIGHIVQAGTTTMLYV